MYNVLCLLCCRASVDAVTQFAVAYFRAAGGQSSAEYGQIVGVLVPKLCTMVKEDDEVGVASICLESLTELLKETKAGVTTANPAFPQAIVATVAAVLKSECACMDTGDDDGEADGEDDDIEESEQVRQSLPGFTLCCQPSQESQIDEKLECLVDQILGFQILQAQDFKPDI